MYLRIYSFSLHLGDALGMTAAITVLDIIKKACNKTYRKIGSALNVGIKNEDFH